MKQFVLNVGGHAVGLANALSHEIENAAFKMPHPLKLEANVILLAESEDRARTDVVEGLGHIVKQLDELLESLPPEATMYTTTCHWSDRRTPEPDVRLHLRQISEED